MLPLNEDWHKGLFTLRTSVRQICYAPLLRNARLVDVINELTPMPRRQWRGRGCSREARFRWRSHTKMSTRARPAVVPLGGGRPQPAVFIHLSVLQPPRPVLTACEKIRIDWCESVILFCILLFMGEVYIFSHLIKRLTS